MDVALVVPVLNEARLVEELACSLDALAHRAEVVVVDGGSTDGTRDQLASRARSFRVIDAPRGRARQMNVGARATSAPVLLFLHADTRLPDGAVELACDAVARGAVGGCFKLRIASADLRLKLAAHIINARSRFIHSATGDQAIFARRSTFEQLGGFRDLELCEDLDLTRRLRALGPIALVDAAVETSARRWERGGVSRTIALMWALRLSYHLGIDPSKLRRLYEDVR
jgi:rSAM/selenodomain-associated transferase 2